jgi:hypothetical protein
MNIIRKLMNKPTRTGDYMHTEVANEVEFLIVSALTQCDVAGREKIAAEVKRDPMTWFRTRPHQYGESGSHYGHAELVATPGGSDPAWPTWVTLIPTAQIREMWLAAGDLSKKRRPLGGHNMDEENRRRAVCEFADHVVWRLLDDEEKARPSTPPVGK